VEAIFVFHHSPKQPPMWNALSDCVHELIRINVEQGTEVHEGPHEEGKLDNVMGERDRLTLV